jgi:hypothetical protein
VAPVLTQIYRYHTYSCHELLRVETAHQAQSAVVGWSQRRPPNPHPPTPRHPRSCRGPGTAARCVWPSTPRPITLPCSSSAPATTSGSGGHATAANTPDGAAAVASLLAAVLAEIYLCGICSCQEIVRRNGRGQIATIVTAASDGADSPVTAHSSAGGLVAPQRGPRPPLPPRDSVPQHDSPPAVVATSRVLGNSVAVADRAPDSSASLLPSFSPSTTRAKKAPGKIGRFLRRR